MFSRKKLIVPALFMLLAPSLAACGGDTATSTPAASTGGTEATATSAPVAQATDTTAPAAQATDTTAPSSGGTGGTSGQAFRWRAFDEPPTFDPALMEDFLAIDLGQNLYDSVTQF